MRHRGTLIFLVGFVLMLSVALAPAGAQSAGGILEGRVLDPDGAALPGATVTATNSATGVARAATTDAGVCRGRSSTTSRISRSSWRPMRTRRWPSRSTSIV